MAWLLPALVATTANSLILTLAYFYLAGVERQRALKIIGLGWGLYALRFVLMIAWVQTGQSIDILFALNQLAMPASCLVVLFGVLELEERRARPWFWYILAALTTYTAWAAFVVGPNWVYYLPLHIVSGLAFFSAGIQFIRSPWLQLPEAKVVGWAFVIWGLHKLDYPLLRPVEWVAPWGYLLGAVLAIVCAIGIILIYLRLEKQQAMDSRELYRTLVEGAPVPILVHREGAFIYANKAAVQLYDAASTGDLVGIPIVSYMDEDDVHKVYAQGPEQPELLPDSRTLKLTLHLPSGRVKLIDAHAITVAFEGAPARMVFCRDLTEEARLEQQLRQSQKLEAIGTLAGGIAHDFNNILFGIQGYSDLAKGLQDSGSEAEEYLQEVSKACTRAAGLVNQILSFSRRSERKLVQLNLVPVVKEVAKLMRATLPANIEVSCDSEPGSAWIKADPGEIHQVLINLCTNAGQAMRSRAGKLDLRLKQAALSEGSLALPPSLAPGEYYLLAVSDTGAGISDSDLEHIFEPFFTTKNPGDGTGLGLALSHSIVTNLNGAIAVESKLGEGSTFTVLLPVLEALAQEPTVAEQQPVTGKGRLMVVDDERMLADLLGQMAVTLGYTAETHYDSQQALAAFSADSNKFDAVLTDQTMPRLTGSELAAELARLSPETPVLILTGYQEGVAAETERLPNVRTILGKPVSRLELSQALSQALEPGGEAGR